jgi:pyroglutamyl-peptidase
MSGKQRVLITGFGPFPGAPYNPTGRLVARLVQLRRPALADAELIGHIFHVSYGAVDRELPALLARHAPDALLMFGLAQRTPYVRVETRARNTITTLWPDADHTRIGTTRIAPHDAASRSFGPHTGLLLRAAEESGVWVKPSRDAGRYLCNYLCWKALEATDTDGGPRLAAFIHVPLVPRDPVGRLPSAQRRISFEELVDAGEAVLMAMVKLARQRALAFEPG